MAAEQFCLKWNNYQSSILTAFESLQVTEDLADVTLACEGISVKAHKFILSVCSPYFRTVFKENPCSHPIVILKDVLYRDMLAVLNFMYHGEVLVSKEELQTFLQTAELLQVSGLKGLSHLCQKKKTKRTAPATEEAENKKHKTKPNVPVMETTEDNCNDLVSVDEIKMEIEDVNFNVDVSPHSGGSLLEAALEVRKSPGSILERSLTSHRTTAKSPLNSLQHAATETSKQLHIPRKPPDEFEPVIEDLVKRETETDTEEQLHNNESNSSDPQALQAEALPHHSSQCGNCPHCGKIYSNQSALKYHVRLVHSDLLNLYCCHLCPLMFDFRDSYKKHMTDVHSLRS